MRYVGSVFDVFNPCTQSLLSVLYPSARSFSLHIQHFFPFFFISSFLSSSSSSSSPRLQVMECVQGGFVNMFVSEMALKTAAFSDDFLVVSGGANGLSGDDLFVDELLNFSNGFSEEEEEQAHLLEEPEKKEQDKNVTCSVSQVNLTVPENSALSVNNDFGSLPESELSVPLQAEGLESLEWLSHFVEDSFSDYSLTGKLMPKPTENQREPEATLQEQPCLTTPFQTKARTKRVRTGVRVWPILSPSIADSSTSPSSSSSSTTSFSPPNPWAIQTGESFYGKLSAKKQKKRPINGSASGRGGAAQPRRCSHCGVTKTPQWRAGPLGWKTLCNACGVRYKSGRLLPEYRPACSPTFSSELHSNNHRKVLEMRRKKELEVEAAGLAQPVPSF